MSDLVQRLSVGEHPVEVSLRPARTLAVLKECLDRGYVHVKFTGTRGGTELGVPVDAQQSDFTAAAFDAGIGRFRLVGALTLDYVKVRCVADIDVASLQGSGHLEILESSGDAV
jgi:hypothetical protein